MNHEWWQGCLAGGNELGYVPDGYIKLKVRWVSTQWLSTCWTASSRLLDFSRRRDSAPVQHLPPLSITPDPSSSLHSINFTISSTDQLNVPLEGCQSSSMSLVDEDRLQSAKETEIVEVDSEIEDDSDQSQENTYENTKSVPHPKVTPRSIYDVLPPTPPMRPPSTADRCHSTSSTSSSSRLTSTNEQQIIDIDTALREVLSGIRTVEECHAQCFRSIPPTTRQSDERLSTTQETDAPDLVLNLPISSGLVTPPATKSLDNNLNESKSSKSTSSSDSSPIHQTALTNNGNPLTQSMIMHDSVRTSRSSSSSTTAVHFLEKVRPSPEPTHRKKIPPPIMKKPEKTVELLKRLGLPTPNESSCGATSSSSSVSSSSSSSPHVYLTQSQSHQHAIHAAGSSKTTDV